LFKHKESRGDGLDEHLLGIKSPRQNRQFFWKDFGNLSSFWRCGKLLSCVAVGENLGDFNLLWLLSWLLLFFFVWGGWEKL
jgi:hypothetical protein